MKKNLLIVLLLFTLGNQFSFAQTPVCQQIKKELGNDKVLQLYWTEMLGEFLLAHPELAVSKYELENLNITRKIKGIYYEFDYFVLVVYDEEFDVKCNNADNPVLMNTRFESRKYGQMELNDSSPVREEYFKISKGKPFDPDEKALDQLCERLFQ